MRWLRVTVFRMQGEADAGDEPDYMIFLTQGLYELRSGTPEVALEYLNNAIKLEPEDELPFIVRSQCLNRSVPLHSLLCMRYLTG